MDSPFSNPNTPNACSHSVHQAAPYIQPSVLLPAAREAKVNPQKPWVRPVPRSSLACPELRGCSEPRADLGHIRHALGLALDAITFLRNIKEGVSFLVCRDGAW